MYAQVDLHQLGAGYMGHTWFTHVYPNTYDPSTPGNAKHEVVASWTPDLSQITSSAGQHYDVLVHLPSHGAETDKADYIVYGDATDTVQGDCMIDQGGDTGAILDPFGHDTWVYLGNWLLHRGARVAINNLADPSESADGTVDIAFDAMAFVPTNGVSGNHCEDSY